VKIIARAAVGNHELRASAQRLETRNARFRASGRRCDLRRGWRQFAAGGRSDQSVVRSGCSAAPSATRAPPLFATSKCASRSVGSASPPPSGCGRATWRPHGRAGPRPSRWRSWRADSRRRSMATVRRSDRLRDAARARAAGNIAVSGSRPGGCCAIRDLRAIRSPPRRREQSTPRREAPCAQNGAAAPARHPLRSASA
jgi:hypothetical protein